MGFTAESLKEAMKYMLESKGFDRVLRKMKLQSATPGKVVCEMKVEEEHTNRGGTLHGGLTATLVDVVSTAALLYTERAAPGVSVDMNITYTSAAKIGEEILITAQILKQGKTLAFATVDLTNKATGKLIAQGLDAALYDILMSQLPQPGALLRILRISSSFCNYLDEQRGSIKATGCTYSLWRLLRWLYSY